MSEDPPSLWRRFKHTPLRDVLWGGLTGRYDRNHQIAQSQLPPEVCDLIRSAVRGAGMGGETQYRFLQDLIAYCRQELSRGRSAAELIEAFGDPKTVGRLTRRAMSRDLSLPGKAVVGGFRLAGAACVLIAVMYVVSLVRAVVEEPRLTRDYVAELAAQAETVPAADRAWPLYSEAVVEHKLFDVYDALATEQDAADYWDDAVWLRVTEVCEANGALLALLRDGAAKPALGFVPRLDRQLTAEQMIELCGETWQVSTDSTPYEVWVEESIRDIPMPYQLTRAVVGCLAVDMMVAARAGDADRVVADFTAMTRVAGQFARDVPASRANGLLPLANDALAYVLSRHADVLTDAHLADLINVSLASDAWLQWNPDTDAMLLDDMIQRYYTLDVFGNGHVTVQAAHQFLSPSDENWYNPTLRDYVLAPLMRWLVMDRRAMERWAAQARVAMQAQVHTPLWERLKDEGAFEAMLMQPSVWSRVRLGPAYWDMQATRDVYLKEAAAVSEAMRLVMTIEQYRRQHGAYPADLAALVPRWLPAVPLDHSTGEPLIYRVTDAGFVLYGRGMDGDDDGGVRDDKYPAWWPSISYDGGDWLLWPREVRPPQPEEDFDSYGFY